MAARHLSPDHEEAMCARLVQVETEAWDRIKVDQHSFTLAQLLAEASEAVGLDVAAAVLEEASRPPSGRLDPAHPPRPRRRRRPARSSGRPGRQGRAALQHPLAA